MAGAAGAAKLLGPGPYVVKTTNFTLSSRAFGGNYLSCPTGDRIVASGGFWHASGSSKPVPGVRYLTNSTSTTDGKGSYAPETTDFPLSHDQFGGGYLSCPKGDRIVTGGAFWPANGSGTPIPEGGFLSSSSPTTNGKGWYATGQNIQPGTTNL